jgi:hypothetical protein
MKFLKTHYGRAINVIPSDTVNIPNPAGLGLEGVTDNADTNKLIVLDEIFTTNLLGAIVVNTSTTGIANVIGFESKKILLLDADIFASGGENFAIYNSDNNQGCAIYIPQAAPNQLTVLTVGGDVITFQLCGNDRGYSILPVNVLRVFDTGTELTDLIALW